MRDALTIVVVHIPRQQRQSLLHVGQQFRLKAGPDFLQRVNDPGHFVCLLPSLIETLLAPVAACHSTGLANASLAVSTFAVSRQIVDPA